MQAPTLALVQEVKIQECKIRELQELRRDSAAVFCLVSVVNLPPRAAEGCKFFVRLRSLFDTLKIAVVC